MDAGQMLVALAPTALLVVLFKLLKRAIQSERWQRMRGNLVISVAIALCFVVAFVAAVTTVVLEIRRYFDEGLSAVLSALVLFLITVFVISKIMDLVVKPSRLSSPAPALTTTSETGHG